MSDEAIELYTVEYEELRPGVLAGGVVMMWFSQVETFRKGLTDDPLGRARKRFDQLRSAADTFRNVQLHGWQAVRIGR